MEISFNDAVFTNRSRTDCSESGNAISGVFSSQRNFESSTAELQHSDFVTPSSWKEHMSTVFGIGNSIRLLCVQSL